MLLLQQKIRSLLLGCRHWRRHRELCLRCWCRCSLLLVLLLLLLLLLLAAHLLQQKLLLLLVQMQLFLRLLLLTAAQAETVLPSGGP